MGGIIDYIKGKPEPEPEPTPTLSEVFDQYGFVEVDENNGTILMSRERNEGHVFSSQDPGPRPTPGREIGASGMSKYSVGIYAEYLSELRGQTGLRMFRKMRNDAQVNGMLQVAKTPVLAARWFVEPSSTSAEDKKIAEFIWNNLTRWLNVSWSELIQEALYMLDYGHYVFEVVWDTKVVDGEELLVWKKFSPRHPLEIYEWDYDPEGGPNGIMYGHDHKFIPISKLLVFTKNKEAGDMQGVSVLRGAYKHWFFKEQLYQIDAIQKERHGIGIPIIVLPPGFTKEDKAKAHEIGENLRTNERAHVVIPPNWSIEFAKIEGQPVDALESAKHHGDMLFENVMANFMLSSLSINSPAETQEQMFLRGTRYIAEIIRDVFNFYAIPQLVRWNFGDEVEPPQLHVRRVGDTTDWRTISFAMRNFAGMKALVPDDALETWVREEMDLPNADPETAREVDPDTGNAEGGGGTGRQPKTANTNTGSKDVGRDGSGG
jgi:hypothetical protein